MNREFRSPSKSTRSPISSPHVPTKLAKPSTIQHVPTTQSRSTPLITILVPIYNSATYLSHCLDTILAQTLPNLTILCLNDGSTDQSPAILQKYARQDPRIKIITKPNTGYGDTMNQGIKRTTTPYLGIVEPDDFIDPNMFQDLYTLIKKYDADIVKSNYYEYRHHQDTLKSIINPSEQHRLINPTKSPHIFHQPPSIWSALYRRSFLEKNRITFLPTPGASYQDTSFNFKVFASTNKVIYTEKAYLHYRQDNASSSIKSTDKIFSVSQEYAEIEHYLRLHRKYQTLAPTMQAAKFAAYHWNLLRLPDPALQQFLPVMRAEFQKAAAAHTLHRQCFPLKHWFMLQVLLKSPQTFLRLFRLYRHPI